MRLHDLLAAVPGLSANSVPNLEISDIQYDSRRVGLGSLFVAVPQVGGDARSGGFHFIGTAVQRGAVAVVSQAPPDDQRVPVIVVDDVRAALGDLAARWYGYPSRKLALYAVTGTDGKTTTTYLLEQILSAAGFRTGLMGTVETKIGDMRERNLDRMTTPESLEVQALLARMVEAGVTHAALEASSHALALERLLGCTFAATALTNITADHVEFHGSWEAYFAAKLRLFTDLAPEAPKFINLDDEHAERWLASVPGPVRTYGIERPADISARSPHPSERGTFFELSIGDASYHVDLSLPGLYNVSNALAAAGLATTAGIDPTTIARALSHAVPPPGRLERVVEDAPFTVLVDYAHTVHAFRSVMTAVRDRTPGKLIAVFGATGSRDRAKRAVLAQIARERADFFIITNEDPYAERAEAIIAEIAAGVPASEEGVRYTCEVDRGRAIERAIRAAQPGDTVLILGKGHEQSIVVDGAKQPWNDVDAARRAVAGVL